VAVSITYGAHRVGDRDPEAGDPPVALVPAVKAEGPAPIGPAPFRISARRTRDAPRRAGYGQSLSVAVKVILPLLGS
jgi:hypothetical protein